MKSDFSIHYQATKMHLKNMLQISVLIEPHPFYLGLIQSNCTLDQHHGNGTHRGHTRGSGSNGSTSSSSSPALFDSNSGIDMPLLSNTQHFHHQTQISSSKLQQNKKTNNYESTAGNNNANSSAYATVLPSANIQTTPRQQNNYYQQKNLAQVQHNQRGLIIDSQSHQQQQQQNYMNHAGSNSTTYMSKHQLQQNSPSLNHSHEYGKQKNVKFLFCLWLVINRFGAGSQESFKKRWTDLSLLELSRAFLNKMVLVWVFFS